MKIRTDFVTNSSSSSFICCITGEAEAGHDSVPIDEYGYWQCECGHQMLAHYKIEKPLKEIMISTTSDRIWSLKCNLESYQKQSKIGTPTKHCLWGLTYYAEKLEKLEAAMENKDSMTDSDIEKFLYDNDLNSSSEGPTICCPICQMKELAIDDKLAYLTKIADTDDKKLHAEVTGKFKTYKEFTKFVEDK